MGTRKNPDFIHAAVCIIKLVKLYAQPRKICENGKCLKQLVFKWELCSKVSGLRKI